MPRTSMPRWPVLKRARADPASVGAARCSSGGPRRFHPDFEQPRGTPMTSNSSIGGLLRRPEAGAFLGLVAVLIFFAIFGGVTFLKPAGMSSWLNVAANLGVIAIPVGLLMIAGELDISVGAMVPLGAMTVAVVSGHFGLSIWLGVALTLSFGVIVGLINGYMVIRTAVPSLIVTLGSLFAVQGIVLGLTVLITKSTSVALDTEGPAKAIFVHFSRFGNWIFAMGGDKVSARNAGIPTERLTITLFVLSPTSAAFVGMC